MIKNNETSAEILRAEEQLAIKELDAESGLGLLVIRKLLKTIWIGRFYVTGILTTENYLRVSMILFLRLCCVRNWLSGSCIIP